MSATAVGVVSASASMAAVVPVNPGPQRLPFDELEFPDGVQGIVLEYLADARYDQITGRVAQSYFYSALFLKYCNQKWFVWERKVDIPEGIAPAEMTKAVEPKKVDIWLNQYRDSQAREIHRKHITVLIQGITAAYEKVKPLIPAEKMLDIAPLDLAKISEVVVEHFMDVAAPRARPRIQAQVQAFLQAGIGEDRPFLEMPFWRELRVFEERRLAAAFGTLYPFPPRRTGQQIDDLAARARYRPAMNRSEEMIVNDLPSLYLASLGYWNFHAIPAGAFAAVPAAGAAAPVAAPALGAAPAPAAAAPPPAQPGIAALTIHTWKVVTFPYCSFSLAMTAIVAVAEGFFSACTVGIFLSIGYVTVVPISLLAFFGARRLITGH